MNAVDEWQLWLVLILILFWLSQTQVTCHFGDLGIGDFWLNCAT